MAVAVEIGEPRLEILEHGVVLEPHRLALAVAGFDHQGAGLDLVAENAVVVARGRLGEPGARDVAGAGGDAAVRQRAVRQFGLGRLVDKGERRMFARERRWRYHSPPALTRTWPSTVSIAVTRAGASTCCTRHSAAWAAPAQAASGKCQAKRGAWKGSYNFTRRSRNALPTTLTEESAIAAAAMIGDSSRPKVG